MTPDTLVKECPHCHTNHAIPIYVVKAGGNIVICCNCGYRTARVFETEEEALEVWNNDENRARYLEYEASRVNVNGEEVKEARPS